MSRGHASRWEGDESDPWGEPAAPLRAKTIVRPTPAEWELRDDAWYATIGLWAVRVAKGPSSTWEWSAFAKGGHSDSSRALRCTGFRARESAQRDAESSLPG